MPVGLFCFWARRSMYTPQESVDPRVGVRWSGSLVVCLSLPLVAAVSEAPSLLPVVRTYVRAHWRGLHTHQRAPMSTPPFSIFWHVFTHFYFRRCDISSLSLYSYLLCLSRPPPGPYFPCYFMPPAVSPAAVTVHGIACAASRSSDPCPRSCRGGYCRSSYRGMSPRGDPSPPGLG